MMNRYFLTNVFMVVCCVYVIYAIGNYQLLANADDTVAVTATFAAMFLGGAGLYDMYATVREYFKTKK